LTRRKQKSPERLRGPGSGWAQCGYAVVVSTCTSFEIRIRFFLLVRKRARIVDPRITKVKKNFLMNGSLTQQNARRFFETEERAMKNKTNRFEDFCF